LNINFAVFLLYGYQAYSMSLYASSIYSDEYRTSNPGMVTGILTGMLAFASIVLIILLRSVKSRQDKVMDAAIRTNAIVTSMFPANVRDRILKDAEEQVETAKRKKLYDKFRATSGNELKNYLEEVGFADEAANDLFATKPIADLFPETTVMMCDLVGFTAWSSVRDPTQVFTLLENVYHGFDQIATRRRVYKVETVGDQYVAICGLPTPRKDHAVGTKSPFRRRNSMHLGRSSDLILFLLVCLQ
jgi:hypothetical protein